MYKTRPTTRLRPAHTRTHTCTRHFVVHLLSHLQIISAQTFFFIKNTKHVVTWEKRRRSNVWTASICDWRSGGKPGARIRPVTVNVEAGYLLTAASCWGSLGLFGAREGHVIINHPGYRCLLCGRDDAAPAALVCSCCFVFIAVSFVNIKAYEHVNHTRFCPRLEF